MLWKNELPTKHKMSNHRYFLALNSMPLFGPMRVKKLLARWPKLEDCFNLSIQALTAAGLPLAQAQQIKAFNWQSLSQDKLFEQGADQTILTWEHPDYPPLLKEIYDPPPVLYAKGDLQCLNQPMLAIVGTRYPSHHGRNTAFEWSKQLSLHGLTIVSGLAKGIDTAAHEGCLAGSKNTIAVLGTGVNLVYPYTNQTLAKQIPRQGLLLSEFPLNFPPKAGHFPRRNRIISGLTVATLVVEATLKSGSLITARYALEQNRDVFALPGSIHLPQTEGCHHLLKQGASLVTCYQDVLMELGLQSQKPASAPHLSPTQDGVLQCIGVETTHIDTIINHNNLTMHEVVCRLAALELSGKIISVPGGYIRTDLELS